jgi:RNA polymerase sigma-70 factor (ECF subfamily)
VSSAPAPNLRELFDAHGRYIWRSLRYLGVRDADLEDVCQEVFFTAHRKLPEFEGRSTLRSWLYGICLRLASDYRFEARATLSRLLELLDQEKREVVVLYELEGFTMKEVASIVGCPLQTAYSRLYAGRETLARAARPANSEPA